MKQLYFLFLFFIMSLMVCNAQVDEKLFHSAGLCSTIEWTHGENPSVIPQAWIYIRDYYLEARYNYEDVKTVSLYFGKSFEINEKVDVEIIPMLGLVYGNIKGVSPGFNLNFEYKRFHSSTECQYTIDFEDNDYSYFWDWSNFYMRIHENISLGCAIQINRSKKGDNFVYASPALSFEFHSFVIETNAYNLWEKNPLWTLGIEYNFK